MPTLPEELRPRPWWLTLPLYAVLVVVIAVDVWSLIFWAQVGASIGDALAIAAAAVALVLTVLLIVDVRRQWLLAHPSDDDGVG